MAHKTGFDARWLMEMAIEAMRKSINEPREDGGIPPKVGAVLWKPDGTIETAARGELRYGDHAEFTLLERKNRSNRLDGSILFATLEPCAPGARNHPKLACAERIVNARIKEVYFGVQDPHPKVAGEGVEFLRRHGVVIRVFDRDLQEIIKQENAEFFDLAERAAEKQRRRATISLSEYERPSGDVLLDDLSAEALKRYQTFLGLGEQETAAFHRRLQQQGLLEVSKDKRQPTGFGTLLFGKYPRDSVAQAGLLGTMHFEDGREEVRDFDGPMVLAPEQVLQWLKDKLPNPISRSGAQRVEVNEALFELVREGVVNALVHRDYSIKGAKCQLSVTSDAVVVKSPGGPIDPITLEQLQAFNAPMVSRNPRLHVVFSKMELAEERGLGLKSMKQRATDVGLPLPKYTWEDPYLVLTFYSSAEGATKSLGNELISELSAEEQKGWSFISKRSGTTQSEYASNLGVTARTAQRHLTHFIELGLLRRVGRGPATEYIKT